MIAVQKGKDRWEINRDANTKVTGDVKVGEKLTITYTMSATEVEVKAGKGGKRKRPSAGAYAVNREQLKSPDAQNASGDCLVAAVLVPSADPAQTRRSRTSTATIYLRRPLPPRIPPRIPRAICRPIELLAARIALFTIEVASES